MKTTINILQWKLVFSTAKRGLYRIAWITQILSNGISTIKLSARRLEHTTLSLNNLHHSKTN